MPEKSYVTIQKCPICQEDMGILMDRRIKDTFESKYTCIPTQVCDDCKKKYLKDGTMLINPDNGKLVVLADGAFKKMFNKEKTPPHKIAFTDDELLEKIRKITGQKK